MKRILESLAKVAKVIVLATLVLWVGDWAVFRLRASRGTAFDSVQVLEYLSTALKGNKQEYEYLGTAPESCARALFPHGGAPACWWLRRHTSQWE